VYVLHIFTTDNFPGAIIISTPQDLALKDAVRGVSMFRKVSVPVLGMIQNMSVFICPHCSQSTHIFGSDGVQRECTKHDIRFLGDVPLHVSICDNADNGRPTVVAEPDSDRAKAFLGIAVKVGEQIGL